MLAGSYTDEEADDLMQFAGEIIDQDVSYLQQWAERQGYCRDMPVEVIFCAASKVILADDSEVTEKMRREIDDVLLVWGSTG